MGLWDVRLPGMNGNRKEVAPVAESRPLVNVMTQTITLDCVDLAGTSRQLEAVMAYDALDPYAITMTFKTKHADVPWVFCRELLLQGISNPTGEGDVHVWPSIDIEGRAVTVIELHSNSGSFVAHARTPEIHEFVSRTLEMVPLGTESIDLDELVDALLPSA